MTVPAIGPALADDLVAGVVRWLLTLSDITAVLGTYPSTGSPWLLQHQLHGTVEGSQSTAAVIGRAGGWSGANEHNTLRFPRLSLEIYADPIRDAAGNVIDPGEAHRRMEMVFTTFDAYLHRPADPELNWGSLRVIAATRQAEPVVYAVPDGDGLLRGQTFYAITQG